jgi:hypothetical protein
MKKKSAKKNSTPKSEVSVCTRCLLAVATKTFMKNDHVCDPCSKMAISPLAERPNPTNTEREWRANG